MAPLGAAYQARVREAFAGRWIDVYENHGKRSGAYSAPVYGAHPYMLMNYNDTLDAMFTLAHELGHSMHTLLSHETQPFIYAEYTIFVAEVPSTLAEALLLDYMLERAKTRDERVVLLQHAIDGIVGTFYNQVLFADFELQAHRLVESDQPVTADALNVLYATLLEEYWGDVLTKDARAKTTIGQVVEGREVRIEREGLKDHRHAAALDRGRGDVRAVERDPAGVRPLEPGDRAQRRGHAGSTRPEDHEELAGRDREVDAVERHNPAVALGEAADP